MRAPLVLGVSTINLHELNKLESRTSVGHKSNWSNGKLRGSRSNKFICTVVAAIRKVPLYGPGRMTGAAGDADRPSYTVMMNDQEATEKVKAGTAVENAQRYDAPQEHSGIRTSIDSGPDSEAPPRCVGQLSFPGLAVEDSSCC
ncbi:hypothetical protein JX266_004678 [Neoarthrinium moseri]|nr:hypothetical protein JX266_004678 [Neoarthrinium moseri]